VGPTSTRESKRLVNNIPLSLENSSTTELVGQLINALVQAPDELNVQVRNITSG
jgi:hypothetical protein